MKKDKILIDIHDWKSWISSWPAQIKRGLCHHKKIGWWIIDECLGMPHPNPHKFGLCVKCGESFIGKLEPEDYDYWLDMGDKIVLMGTIKGLTE